MCVSVQFTHHTQGRQRKIEYDFFSSSSFAFDVMVTDEIIWRGANENKPTSTEGDKNNIIIQNQVDEAKNEENGTYTQTNEGRHITHTHSRTQNGKCMGRATSSIACDGYQCARLYISSFWTQKRKKNWKRLHSALCRNRDLLTYEHCNLCDWPTFSIANISSFGDECWMLANNISTANTIYGIITIGK